MRVNIPFVCSECVHCSNVSFGYCHGWCWFYAVRHLPSSKYTSIHFILIKKNKRYTNTKQNIPYMTIFNMYDMLTRYARKVSANIKSAHFHLLFLLL